ncbi:hypothetical protein IQ268_17010 [Oculatella sp. LEGE 06141]|uniref:DUF6464 family protein n=1 Tax=Oculatella sp. LEGE 06141 TaxID=1828648 RepID=UPI0018822B96|nr:DUF6464 family protein [Oculatella sp. LEGE 06141]MBE9180265.1 hypothetical protein [Oculatella sp. LEGE 06141]
MPKRPECNRCRFNANSSYLVCAVHPSGPDGDRCPDFQADLQLEQRQEQEALAWFTDELEPDSNPDAASEVQSHWQPEGASYYNSELIFQPEQRWSMEQTLELLSWHPLFTGRCPRCEVPMLRNTASAHWDCSCGWKDDSI